VFARSSNGVTLDFIVGREAEIERYYQEHGEPLYRALLSYTGDPDAARDAASESFARALASGEAILSIEPWIWKVAFRIAAKELRHRRSPSLLDRGEPWTLEPPNLIVALAKLSARQRAAVILHYYAGYSLDEIAEILGTTKSTIGVHLHRGRARLRQLLEEDDD
jgi:DNA-directed RNA polymerase specialized sigma24 family protein